jgi:hypothetical protein
MDRREEEEEEGEQLGEKRAEITESHAEKNEHLYICHILSIVQFSQEQSYHRSRSIH